jgi:hypothetical protein
LLERAPHNYFEAKSSLCFMRTVFIIDTLRQYGFQRGLREPVVFFGEKNYLWMIFTKKVAIKS